MKLTSILPSALCFAIALPSLAEAQTCEPGDLQAQLQYLRRMSLDLRGHVPSVDELNSVVTNGQIDPSIIDNMLSSEEFVGVMRAYHRDLLWTNVRDRRLAPNSWRLRGPVGRRPAPAYYIQAANRTNIYRGAAGVQCLDEPATFDAEGNIVTTPSAEDPSIQQEGWVEVTPYWDPTTTVRVCAFDAQANETAIDPRNGNTVQCRIRANVRGCGCGPNLSWCQSDSDGTSARILDSMNEQLLRYADDIVRTDRPYTDIILGKDMELNGRLAHWLLNQAQTGGGQFPAISDQNHPIPDLTYDQEEWVSVERGERHAGVLSMPGFLAKFQANRGRANRFYNAFLCQHFESSEPLPPATDECHREPDLTKRCGCKDCHLALEPAAGHWGRWAEAGLIPMDEAQFPKFNPGCVNGRGDGCNLFYFTPRDVTNPDLENQFVGMLKAYVWASPETEANIEAGPEKIAQESIDAGVFATCAVSRMWTHVMAREPTLEEKPVIDALAEDFSTDYSVKRLVKTLVTTPEYVEAGMLLKK